MHARLGTTPEANLQEGQSDTTPEAMHARLGTTPEANLQEGQSRLATASKGSRMANALDTRPDACRRTIEEIKADLDKNLAARMKDNPLLSDSGKSKMNELLFSPWDDKKQALGAVHFWVAQNASVCGTGWFRVKLNYWKVPKSDKPGETHGGRGVIQCCCCCTWHLKYEEAKGRKLVVYDAVLQHTEPQKHIPIGASDLDLAATPGYNRIPQDLAQEVIWWSKSGIRPRDCLRLLNTKAEYLTEHKGRVFKKPFPWTYDTVYNLVRCGGPVREHDATDFISWLQKRRDDEGLHYSYKTDRTNRLKRVYFELEGAYPWRERGGDLLYFDTTHGTSSYDLKLGTFTSVNGEGKTIVLAAALVASEDTQSFIWVFQELSENMRKYSGNVPSLRASLLRARFPQFNIVHIALGAADWAPRLIFTDSDAAIAAAIRSVWGDRTVHLLCIWHLCLNLNEHASQLFPCKKKDGKAKKKFKRLFLALMTKYGAVDDQGRFEERWAEILHLVHGTSPCPWRPSNLPDETDGSPQSEGRDENIQPSSEQSDVQESGILGGVVNWLSGLSEGLALAWKGRPVDDEEQSAIEEATDDPLLAEVKSLDRAVRPRRRSPIVNGWRWLMKMETNRERWARCFVHSHFTAASFSTGRAEGWHAALKGWLGTCTSLTQLGDKIVRCSDDKELCAKVTARKKRNQTEPTKDPLLCKIVDRVTMFALEKLQQLSVESVECACENQPIRDGDAPEGYGDDELIYQVQDYRDFQGTERRDDKSRDDEDDEDDKVRGHYTSVKRCSCQVPVNTGLPCAHQFAMFRKTGGNIPLELINPLWRVPEADRETYAVKRKAGDALPSRRQDTALSHSTNKDERRSNLNAHWRAVVDFGGEQPHLYPEVLSMVKDLEERVLDLGRNSKKQQRKRKVHDEGGGEEAGKAGKVNDGIVLNPNPKARGPTKRIPNTGDGAKRKGRKVTNE
jgi:hypothetical protein